MSATWCGTTEHDPAAAAHQIEGESDWGVLSAYPASSTGNLYRPLISPACGVTRKGRPQF
jgi:hypothetical protein